MAATKFGNLVIPESFGTYFSEQAVANNAFINSGIVEADPAFTALLARGGLTGNLPFFKHISGADEVLDEDTPLTVGGTTADKEIWAVLARGRAFGATDLAKAFSGADPLGAMANMIGQYWSEKISATLISTLTGVFTDATVASALKLDITGLGTGNDTIKASTVVDAKKKLGDRASKISAIAVHSATFATLQKEQLIVYMRNADFNIDFPTYLGMRVIVDDTLPVDSTYGYYTSYLFAPGAVIYGGNVAIVPFESDRDSLSGQDIFVTRYHYALHPRGMAISTAGISGATPSNAELESDRWTKVWETKSMGIVQFIHKI